MKNFNETDFNYWIQDTKDYSSVNTKEEYLENRLLDCIEYCVTELKMYKNKAYATAELVHTKDVIRLKKVA